MMNVLRRLLHRLGLVDLVWLEWTPQNYPLCVVWREPDGQPWLRYRGVWAKMLPDSRVAPQRIENGWGGTERWYHYDKHPLKLKRTRERLQLTWRRPTRVQTVANKLTGAKYGI